MTTGNRVKDTTATVGTGDITLAGTPAATYQGLAGIPGGVGTKFGYYVGGATEWEAGEGTKTGANTFSRAPESSSNANALVSFSAGTKDFFAALTASEVNAMVFLAAAQTLTNKRITARVQAHASSATPTTNTDAFDRVDITGLAVGITSMSTNLTGTPVSGDSLVYTITDNATARAIAWGAKFEDGAQFTLPTTTVAGIRGTYQFDWNPVTSKWRFMGQA